ncbi:MAG: structural protein [Gammaproteobacteria bacterium]|nr:structural protein [Gammaproteobacteria bacterium]
MSDSRGIRNNNPGNIRKNSTVWMGMAASQTDPSFVQFVASEYGIRAIAKIMRSYRALGLNTLREVVRRWAPPNENNTDAYVAAVCAECSVGPDDTVDLDNVMPLLVKAIIYHENGQCPYTDEQINSGIALA